LSLFLTFQSASLFSSRPTPTSSRMAIFSSTTKSSLLLSFSRTLRLLLSFASSACEAAEFEREGAAFDSTRRGAEVFEYW
jgi:hypothetical protein